MKDLGVCLLLVVAIRLVYGLVPEFSFVAFDDDRRMLLNEHVVSGLSWENVAWSFTSEWDANWSPLTWISHMVDFQLYGSDAPGPHHRTSAILHVLNALLLFALLRSATGSTWRSGVVAGLFAVHPIHVESVAWVSERKSLLSTFFGLLSLWCYVGYAKGVRDRQGATRKLFWLSGLCLGLGLMAKGILITLPVLFLMLDVWPLRRMEFAADASPPESRTARRAQLMRLLLEKAPFIAIVVAAFLATYLAQRHGGSVIPFEALPLRVRVDNAVVSYALYLEKLVWPTRLAVLYLHPSLPGGVPWTLGQVLAAAAFLVAVTVGTLCARRHRYLAVGWLWYLITLLPVIGLIQVGKQALADRYAYVPFIGIYVALTWAGADLLSRRCAESPAWRVVRAAAAIAPLLVLALLARAQTEHWRNTLTLFEHTIQVTRANYQIHYNFAIELKKLGRLEEAIEHYEAALEIFPRMGRARFNLANLFFRENRLDEAIAHYRLVEPGSRVYENARRALGKAVMAKRDIELAVAHWREEVERHPNRASNHAMLGHVLRLGGDADGAIAEYQRAAELDGDHERWEKEIRDTRAQAAEQARAADDAVEAPD
jgi:Flp pilus assembly protein TadD